MFLFWYQLWMERQWVGWSYELSHLHTATAVMTVFLFHFQPQVTTLPSQLWMSHLLQSWLNSLCFSSPFQTAQWRAGRVCQPFWVMLLQEWPFRGRLLISPSQKTLVSCICSTVYCGTKNCLDCLVCFCSGCGGVWTNFVHCPGDRWCDFPHCEAQYNNRGCDSFVQYFYFTCLSWRYKLGKHQFLCSSSQYDDNSRRNPQVQGTLIHAQTSLSPSRPMKWK